MFMTRILLTLHKMYGLDRSASFKKKLDFLITTYKTTGDIST